MCRLHERPRQVGVAALAVARAFLLVVGQALGLHAARIGSVVAHLGKALDRPGLEHDRQT